MIGNILPPPHILHQEEEKIGGGLQRRKKLLAPIRCRRATHIHTRTEILQGSLLRRRGTCPPFMGSCGEAKANSASPRPHMEWHHPHWITRDVRNCSLLYEVWHLGWLPSAGRQGGLPAFLPTTGSPSPQLLQPPRTGLRIASPGGSDDHSCQGGLEKWGGHTDKKRGQLRVTIYHNFKRRPQNSGHLRKM